MTRSVAIMKTFLVFCALLAFVKSDLPLTEIQKALNSFKPTDIDNFSLGKYNDVYKCFLKEFQKEENNERINVRVQSWKFLDHVLFLSNF
jgi:flagellar biosynthesis protein FliR